MKGSVIALGTFSGQEAAARLQDGRLEDLLIEPAKAPPLPGTLFRAICDRPLKGQGGMLLRLPEGETGFLRQGKGLAPGQALLVQVTGFAEPGKAVPVTARILFKSRYAIVTPDAPGLNISRAIRDDDLRDALLEIAHAEMAEGPGGLIVRSAAAEADPDAVADDIATMRDLASRILQDGAGTEAERLLDGPGPHELAWRDWPTPDLLADGPDAFDQHGVEDLIAALDSAHAPLPGGAGMWVEPTRALVAVDINTGRDTSPAAGLKANLAAARDLPRQLRLRGLGGQITLDLAPMPKKDRRTFESALRAALRADPVETALVGWTPLGHYELQRKRERLALTECLPR